MKKRSCDLSSWSLLFVGFSPPWFHTFFVHVRHGAELSGCFLDTCETLASFLMRKLTFLLILFGISSNCLTSKLFELSSTKLYSSQLSSLHRLHRSSPYCPQSLHAFVWICHYVMGLGGFLLQQKLWYLTSKVERFKDREMAWWARAQSWRSELGFQFPGKIVCGHLCL